MSIQGKSLCVLTPMYGGQCHGTYVESFIRLMNFCQQLGVVFNFSFLYNESLISRARNRLVDIYLKTTDMTHSVFIDSDIGFEPEDVLAMLECDKPIIGAGCVKKGLRLDRIQMAVAKQYGNGHEPRTFTQEEMSKLLGDFVINWKRVEGQKEFNLAEPIEVNKLGTGLLMIRRDVYQKYMVEYPDRWYEARGDPAALPGPIHDFFRVGIDPETHDYDSEDYWFCQDCQRIGYPIWLAPWMRTTHSGMYKFMGDLPTLAAIMGKIC